MMSPVRARAKSDNVLIVRAAQDVKEWPGEAPRGCGVPFLNHEQHATGSFSDIPSDVLDVCEALLHSSDGYNGRTEVKEFISPRGRRGNSGAKTSTLTLPRPC